MNSSDMEIGDGNEYGLDASPSSTNNEIGMGGAGEGKTAGQPLSDFLLQLEDYIPTVRTAGRIVYSTLSRFYVACVTSHLYYLGIYMVVLSVSVYFLDHDSTTN
jgi:hypothetical protein